MALRQEFLEHKKKTVDSFSLVSTDISDIHINLSNLKSVIESMESKVDKCMSDINAQRTAELAVNSSIKGIRNTVSEINSKISSAGADTTKKLNSLLRESQDEIRKVKNLINRKSRTTKRADIELETRLKSQRRRILQLNRKIELTIGRKVSARRATRRTARKTIIRKITPRKTVTTIKTPKRTITKTVTKNRVVTKKQTPKTKEVYEVIRGKKPPI